MSPACSRRRSGLPSTGRCSRPYRSPPRSPRRQLRRRSCSRSRMRTPPAQALRRTTWSSSAEAMTRRRTRSTCPAVPPTRRRLPGGAPGCRRRPNGARRRRPARRTPIRIPRTADSPMADSVADGRARHAAIAARLDAMATQAEREALKAEIGALYKSIEQQITELGVLKDDVRKLIERWKTAPLTPGGNGATVSPAQAAPPSNAPAFVGEKPLVHADHLGASTFIEKGWSRISLGDYEGAETALNRALELSPNDPQSESLLGWAQMLQEKYDDALLNFQKVLMRQPSNALARINVGYICLKKRIFGEAIEHLSKAIRLDNDRKATLYAHFYLGLVYLEREMYEDAQTFFKKTLQIGPNLIEAYFELGRALWFDGQKEAAMDAWRDGHRTNKFNPWGKRCGEMLKHVEGGGSLSRSRATA